MKKILLATTILGMTAGFAAAQVSFKGEGKVGFATNGTGGTTANKGKTATAMGLNGVTSATLADDKTEFYSTFKLSVSAAGETDSGLTFGASSSITTGLFYDMADDDGFEVGARTLGTPTLFVAGEFGKIQFKQNGFKEFQDDNAERYDVDYAGSFGGLSIGVRSDLNVVAGNTAAGYNAATAGKSSISLGYTISDITLGALYDEVGGKYGISAARAFGPVTVKVLAEGSTGGTTVSSLKLSYAADGITGSILAKSNNAWEVEAGYAANGITVAAKTTDLSKWKLTAAYDLGGGLSLEGGTNYTNDMFVGAKMSF